MISVMEGAGGRQTSTKKAGESDEVLEIREDNGGILAYFQKTGDSSELSTGR